MKKLHVIFIISAAYFALLWLALLQGFYIFKRPDTFPGVLWARLMECLWSPIGWLPGRGDSFTLIYSIVYSLAVGVCAHALYRLFRQLAKRRAG